MAYLLVRIDTVTGLVTATRLPEALDELERMRSSADDLYQDVRESITELRTQVAERGLASTLREYVDEFEERHDIRITLRGEEATGRLAPLSAYQVLRIVQEALANVRKHARAHTAWIAFDTPDPRTLQVEIGDDGVGFDPATRLASRQQTFGLASMRERAEALGGRFEIASRADGGTRVKVDLPLEEQSNARSALASAAG